MSDHYILDDQGNPIACDLVEWAKWFETFDRHVALTQLPDGTRISTVFLGLDHNFQGGPPVLWESMVFGGPLDQEQRRYTSREDALDGHQELAARAADSASDVFRP